MKKPSIPIVATTRDILIISYNVYQVETPKNGTCVPSRVRNYSLAYAGCYDFI